MRILRVPWVRVSRILLNINLKILNRDSLLRESISKCGQLLEQNLSGLHMLRLESRGHFLAFKFQLQPQGTQRRWAQSQSNFSPTLLGKLKSPRHPVQ